MLSPRPVPVSAIFETIRLPSCQRRSEGHRSTSVIPEVQPRDPVQVVDDLGQQDVVRVTITLPRPPDQLGPRHRSLASG
jgi:hypothetical protein